MAAITLPFRRLRSSRLFRKLQTSAFHWKFRPSQLLKTSETSSEISAEVAPTPRRRTSVIELATSEQILSTAAQCIPERPAIKITAPSIDDLVPCAAPELLLVQDNDNANTATDADAASMDSSNVISQLGHCPMLPPTEQIEPIEECPGTTCAPADRVEAVERDEQRHTSTEAQSALLQEISSASAAHLTEHDGIAKADIVDSNAIDKTMIGHDVDQEAVVHENMINHDSPIGADHTVRAPSFETREDATDVEVQAMSSNKEGKKAVNLKPCNHSDLQARQGSINIIQADGLHGSSGPTFHIVHTLDSAEYTQLEHYLRTRASFGVVESQMTALRATQKRLDDAHNTLGQRSDIDPNAAGVREIRQLLNQQELEVLDIMQNLQTELEQLLEVEQSEEYRESVATLAKLTDDGCIADVCKTVLLPSVESLHLDRNADATRRANIAGLMHRFYELKPDLQTKRSVRPGPASHLTVPSTQAGLRSGSDIPPRRKFGGAHKMRQALHHYVEMFEEYRDMLDLGTWHSHRNAFIERCIREHANKVREKRQEEGSPCSDSESEPAREEDAFREAFAAKFAVHVQSGSEVSQPSTDPWQDHVVVTGVEDQDTTHAEDNADNTTAEAHVEETHVLAKNGASGIPNSVEIPRDSSSTLSIDACSGAANSISLSGATLEADGMSTGEMVGVPILSIGSETANHSKTSSKLGHKPVLQPQPVTQTTSQNSSPAKPTCDFEPVRQAWRSRPRQDEDGGCRPQESPLQQRAEVPSLKFRATITDFGLDLGSLDFYDEEGFFSDPTQAHAQWTGYARDYDIYWKVKENMTHWEFIQAKHEFEKLYIPLQHGGYKLTVDEEAALLKMAVDPHKEEHGEAPYVNLSLFTNYETRMREAVKVDKWLGHISNAAMPRWQSDLGPVFPDDSDRAAWPIFQTSRSSDTLSLSSAKLARRRRRICHGGSYDSRSSVDNNPRRQYYEATRIWQKHCEALRLRFKYAGRNRERANHDAELQTMCELADTFSVDGSISSAGSRR